MDWTPVTQAALLDNIFAAEGRMNPQVFRLWQAIRTAPEKWREKSYGAEGGGFWVVAIIGRKAIWYNDIEDGFNCSSYATAGELAEYFCNQDELEHAVQKILTIIESGNDSATRCGPSWHMPLMPAE